MNDKGEAEYSERQKMLGLGAESARTTNFASCTPEMILFFPPRGFLSKNRCHRPSSRSPGRQR